MTNPVGRPKLPESESRHRLLTCRLSIEEERQVERAAHQSGRSRSDWVRAALMAAVGGLPEAQALPSQPRTFANPDDTFLD